jgi:hypothetical protein
MADEMSRKGDEVSEAAAGVSDPSVVSLNLGRGFVGLPLDRLTSADLRDLLQIGRHGPVSACGCDAGPDGNCGCRGLNCDCNKVKSGLQDLSVSEFLRDREQTIRELRRQLETQRVTDEQLERLRDDS